MNYYDAREMRGPDGQPAGRYHYTCQNRRIGMYPVGYCAQGCEGHDTKEGAYAHQREYILDTARYDVTVSRQQRECEVCKTWTQRAAEADHMDIHILCDEHCNREGLAKVLPEVGYAVASW